jgi:hypothetical protein
LFVLLFFGCFFVCFKKQLFFYLSKFNKKMQGDDINSKSKTIKTKASGRISFYFLICWGGVV